MLLNIPWLVKIARGNDVPLLLRPRRRALGVYLARVWLLLLTSIAAAALFLGVALLIQAGGGYGPVFALVLVIVAAILVALFAILCFLWAVYSHGGPRDVAAVAKVIREIYDPWAHQDLSHKQSGDDADHSSVD